MSKILYVDQHNYVELPENTASLSQDIVTASSAYDFQDIMGFLPNPDPVLKAEGRDIDMYESLLFDAHVGAVVDSLIDGVKALEWDVDRGKSRSRHAKDVKGWLNDFDIHGFVEGVVNARLYGYQPFEVMWRDTGSGLKIPDKTVAKPPKWFVYGPAGDLRFRTREAQSDGVSLEQYPRKFLVPRYKATYKNPYGTGVLSRCFWPVAFKKGGLKFWLLFVEKFGGPHVVIKVPQSMSDADRAKHLTMGRLMVQDAVAVVTDTTNLELLESTSKTGSADLYDQLLKFQNEEISKAVKSETLTTQIGDKGSYAAGRVHAQVAGTGIQSATNLVESCLNTLVGWYMDVNVSESVAPPRVILYEEEDVDKDLAERDKTLTESGVKLSRSYWIRAYGFDESDIEDAAAPAAVDPAIPSFGEPDEMPDQEAVDRALDGLTDEQLQSQMQGVLKPVFELVYRATSFSEVMDKLTGLYPDLPTDDVEKLVARLMYESEIRGRINAEG